MSDKVRMKFIVYGLVQGVGFRYFVYKHATELNLKGYAKNLFDGTVEVLLEGNSQNINKLYDILLQGPSRSHVDKIDKYEYDFTGILPGFEIK